MSWGDLHFFWIAGVFILIVCTLVLNAVELQLMARGKVERKYLRSATVYSVAGAIANLLPVPGGLVVRVRYLSLQGVSVQSGLIRTAIVYGVWILCIFVFTFALLFLYYDGISALIIGAAVSIVGILFYIHRRKSYIIAMGLNRLAIIIFDFTSIVFVSRAIGVEISFVQQIFIPASSLLGAVGSIFPIGIPVREVLPFAFEAALGVPTEALILSLAIYKICVYLVLMMMSPILVLKSSVSLPSVPD